MSALLHLRGSRVPLAMACPESTIDDGGPKLVSSGEPANLGSAIHDTIAAWIERDYLPDSASIDHFGERHAVENFDELRWLTWATWNLLLKVRQWYPGAEPEVELEHIDEANGIRLTGRLDLASIIDHEKRLNILDYKSGRLEVDASHQLRTYAYLGLQKRQDIKIVWASVLRVRDGSIDPCPIWTREDLDHWYAGLVARVKRRGHEEYNPGAHCAFCPRALTCPGKEAYLRQARMSLLDIHNHIDIKSGLLQLPEDPVACGTELSNLLDRIKVIERVCEAAKDLVKAHIKATGPLPTADGQEVAIKCTEQKPLDFGRAWPILKDRIPEEAWPTVFRVSKGEAEKAIKGTLPRGAKTAAWIDLLKQLDQAGALGRKSIEQLVTRKAPVAIEQPRAEAPAIQPFQSAMQNE